MNCPTCRQPMRNTCGIGESAPRWVCNHTNCPSHHQSQRCPTCNGSPSEVQVEGIGAFQFTCEQGHSWPSL